MGSVCFGRGVSQQGHSMTHSSNHRADYARRVQQIKVILIELLQERDPRAAPTFMWHGSLDPNPDAPQPVLLQTGQDSLSIVLDAADFWHGRKSDLARLVDAARRDAQSNRRS